VASNQITGQTLHSLLRLPINKNFQPLQDADVGALQNRLRHLKYLVIDEKSMLGLQTLGWIDSRLRQVFPDRQDEWFGGVSILLVGDFFQLPPVQQKPLYSNGAIPRAGNGNTHHYEIIGQNAYRQFDKTVFLKTIQRQQGSDQSGFRKALEELRHLELSVSSWELLSSRVQSELSDNEIHSFRNALRIYSTKKRVKQYNYDHLVALNKPVVQVHAQHTGKNAENASSEKAGNLVSKFPVCIGARVMMTRNIWPAVGLVNGAQGTVKDLGWAPGADVTRDPPCVLMVRFDQYDGPAFEVEGVEVPYVPIFPVRQDFNIGNEACSRKQFPLTVAYAITVHKSQSITVDQVVTDLSERDFQHGLSYVAVSRVKTLRGLMLELPFERNTLYYPADKRPPGLKAKLEDQARRQGQRLLRPLYGP
jgi:ATP-dependent exoDNAse (exonuclease V) alpha subunit